MYNKMSPVGQTFSCFSTVSPFKGEDETRRWPKDIFLVPLSDAAVVFSLQQLTLHSVTSIWSSLFLRIMCL